MDRIVNPQQTLHNLQTRKNLTEKQRATAIAFCIVTIYAEAGPEQPVNEFVTLVTMWEVTRRKCTSHGNTLRTFDGKLMKKAKQLYNKCASLPDQ